MEAMVEAAERQGCRRFASFAVLDLETSNLPQFCFNKVGITEMAIYAFTIDEMQKAKKADNAETEDSPLEPPQRPRVLHKLTLMINPRMRIDPIGENITGLNNYMLEFESSFDDNVANTLAGFLKHLQQPVCLVAHNGWNFDFPIIKSKMNKLNKADLLPSDMLCLDSLRAFHDIDVIREESLNNDTVTNACNEKPEINEAVFDARAMNETTPKRPIINATTAAIKRKRARDGDENGDDDDDEADMRNVVFKSRRSLNFSETNGNRSTSFANGSHPVLSPHKRWFPPKNKYKLGNIYKRVFTQEPVEAHFAESDVMTLMQLMLHYGEDFVEYADSHAILFESIRAIDEPKNF